MTITINKWYTCCKRIIRVQHSRCTLRTQTENLFMAPPIVYHSLESVLSVLNDPQFKETAAVKSLMEIYKDVHKKNQIGQGDQKKYPLIVMEGLDGSGKTTTTRALAKKIGAEVFCTPPPCMHQIRNLFDDDALLRTAYYALGNYVAALEISTKLREKPIILDRFWHSTTAYAIAEAVKNNPTENKLPPTGDEIYHWPKDLLKPDIVLLLAVSENERVRRHARRNTITDQEERLKADKEFRENIVTAYGNMWDPSIEFVNADLSKKAVLNELFRKVNVLLQ